MIEKASRRESAKQKTRQALLEAGLAEIIEKGVDRPSLDSICARAGFTRGAFYVQTTGPVNFIIPDRVPVPEGGTVIGTLHFNSVA